METRSYKNLDAFNRLRMRHFLLDRLEFASAGDYQNLVVMVGEYMEHFGAEITFVEVRYIACALSFVDSTLHRGSVQDFPVAKDYPECQVYYFEEDDFLPGEKPVRYYIVAREVAIQVHYAGENVERVFGPSDQIEQGVAPALPRQAWLAPRKRKSWWHWR